MIGAPHDHDRCSPTAAAPVAPKRFCLASLAVLTIKNRTMKTPIRFPITLGRRTASHQHGTALLLSVLVALLLWTLAIGARAQPDVQPIADKTAPAVQPSPTPSPTPTCTPAQNNPLPADGDLKFVVAVFRHGVRSPLEDFAEKTAPLHSGTPWPGLNDWAPGDKSAKWGDLTPHGATAVSLLGAWYGKYYSKAWGKCFNAYLWADTDERTEKTAAALATGLGGSGSATVASLPPGTTDPLFHPFKASCGTPDKLALSHIVARIKANYPDWRRRFADPLRKLEDVLACKNACWGNGEDKTLAQGPSPTPPPCEPLHCIKKAKVSAWGSPTPTPRPASPIIWDDQFSYASSATEAFLLEYANGMTPGWGHVEVGQKGPDPELSDLLRLHEFYFDITERDKYLAHIQGANLLREILDQLNREAGKPLEGKCPRGDGKSQFVGLVGHDTNLANLNELLNVRWTFKDPQLPDDTRNLPDNDALPAGALVFELRGGNPEYRVRIQYVTQSLGEIRNAPQPGDAYRVPTTCSNKSGPCEMSLGEFTHIAKEVIKNYPDFLSKCHHGQQTCLKF
jgi:4-phytase/acid phosphatase